MKLKQLKVVVLARWKKLRNKLIIIEMENLNSHQKKSEQTIKRNQHFNNNKIYTTSEQTPKEV